MYLLIDNSKEDEVNFYFDADTNFVQKTYPIEDSEHLLEILKKFLKDNKKKLKDLKGMGVLLGQGRFTGTRIAATIVNTLSFSLQIPVVGVKELDFSDFLKKIKKAKVGVYVSPTYSGEASIGKAKKKNKR